MGHRITITIVAVYLLIGLAALIIALSAAADESLAAIFLVLVAMPWTVALTWLTEKLAIDTVVFNYTVLSVGILVNAGILYWVLSWTTGRRRR